MKIYNLLTKLEAKKPIPIFSLDIHEKLLIISSTNGDVDLYKEEVLYKSVKKHSGAVLCVRFNNQGSMIASCGDDGTVIIYDMELNVLNYFKNHTGDVTNVLWTDKYLVSVGHDGNIIFYDLLHFKLFAKIKAHENKITGVAGNKKNDFLCSQGEDGIVLYIGTTIYRRIPPFEGVILESFFSRMSWSPDGQIFSCGLSFNQKVNSIEIYNMEMESRYSLLGHVAPCEVTSFNPNMFVDNAKQYFILAAGSQDLSISLWTTLSPYPFLLVKNVAEMPILDLMWSHDGSILYFCSYDGTVGKLEFDIKELGVLSTKDCKVENSDLFLTLLNAELYDKKVNLILKEKDKKPIRKRRSKMEMNNIRELKNMNKEKVDSNNEKVDSINEKVDLNKETIDSINKVENKESINKVEKEESINKVEKEESINKVEKEESINKVENKESIKDKQINIEDQYIKEYPKHDQQIKDEVVKDQQMNYEMSIKHDIEQTNMPDQNTIKNDSNPMNPKQVKKVQDLPLPKPSTLSTLDKLKKIRNLTVTGDLSTDSGYNSSEIQEFPSSTQNIEIHGEPKKKFGSYLEILSHEAAEEIKNEKMRLSIEEQKKGEVKNKNDVRFKGDPKMMNHHNLNFNYTNNMINNNSMMNGHMVNNSNTNNMINNNIKMNGHMVNHPNTNNMMNGHMVNGNMMNNNTLINNKEGNGGIRLSDVIDTIPAPDPRLIPNKSNPPTKVIKRKVVKPILMEEKKDLSKEIVMFNFKQTVKIENGVIEEFYKDFGEYSIELNTEKTLLSIKRSKKDFFEIQGNFKFICASKKYVSVYTSNIEIYDLKTGTLVVPFIGSSSVLYMDIYKDNLLFLEGDGTVIIFDIKKNSIINTRIPRYDTVIKIKFSKLYFVIVEYKDSSYTLDKNTKLWYLLKKDWNDLNTENTDFDNTVDETLKKLENKFLVNYINKRHSKLKKVAKKMVNILLNMKFTDQLENMFKRVFINLIKLGHKKFTVKMLEKLSKNFNLQYFIVEIMKSM